MDPTTTFPEGSPSSYHASYGASLAGLLGPLVQVLGHEVNTSALMSTAMAAAVASLGDKTAILNAIAANAVTIFPDAATRPFIVIALNALVGVASAKLSSDA